MECKNCKFCEFTEIFEDYICEVTDNIVNDKVSKNKYCDINFYRINPEIIEKLRLSLLEDNDKLIDFLDGRYDENMNKAELYMAFLDAGTEKNSEDLFRWLIWLSELYNC